MDAFDRFVLAVIAALLVGIGVVLALGDHVGAPVVAYSPAEGDRPAITAPIRVTFGQRMEAASAEARFALAPPVTGAFSWEGNTLVFTPEQALAPGETYTATLDAGAQSSAGRRTLETLSWSFTPRYPRVLYLSAPLDEGAVRSLWAASLDGGAPARLFAPDYGVYSFAPSPDGSQIAVSVQTATPAVDVWLLDADGANPRLLIDCAPDACLGVAWSPDGQTLAYELSRQGSAPSRIWLYDMATRETGPVFEDDQILGYAPTWSADGKRLAFFDSNAEAIRVLDLDTGDVAVVPTLMGEVGDFAPDGSAMVYTEIRRLGRQFLPELWLADLKPGGGLAPLLDAGEDDAAAAWSPDGQWIAFGRHRLDDGSSSWVAGRQAMLYHVETGELRPLTDDVNYNNTAFAWDPTGQFLLIQRFRLDEAYALPQLWVYDMKRGEMRQLATEGILGRWQP